MTEKYVVNEGFTVGLVEDNGPKHLVIPDGAEVEVTTHPSVEKYVEIRMVASPDSPRKPMADETFLSIDMATTCLATKWNSARKTRRN